MFCLLRHPEEAPDEEEPEAENKEEEVKEREVKEEKEDDVEQLGFKEDEDEKEELKEEDGGDANDDGAGEDLQLEGNPEFEMIANEDSMDIAEMMDVEMREGDEESFEDVEIDVVDIVVDILSELVDTLVDSNDDIFESNYGDVEEEEVATYDNTEEEKSDSGDEYHPSSKKMTRKQMKKRVQKSAEQQETEVFLETEKEDEENFFDVSEKDLGFICVECGVECKDKSHLRNHILAHYYNRFTPYIPAGIPFACPDCGKTNRDRITLIRHYCWAHSKFELVTGLSEDELKPRGLPRAMGGGNRGTSQTTRSPAAQASTRSSPSSRRTPTIRNSRVTITKVPEEQEQVFQIEGEAIEGEKS